jgi:hypothetical protein
VSTGVFHAPWSKVPLILDWAVPLVSPFSLDVVDFTTQVVSAVTCVKDGDLDSGVMGSRPTVMFLEHCPFSKVFFRKDCAVSRSVR